jgi:hypothetical protein
MAEPRIADQSVRIALFAKDELDTLVEIISTEHPDIKVTDVAVISALVIAARRSPPEAVAAYLSTYWHRGAAEVAAIEVVGRFIQAFGR